MHMLNLIRNFKKNSNNDKETYEEFCKVYIDQMRKENELSRKIVLFNPKYFTRKNFRVVVLEQSGSTNAIQYDSYSNNSNALKEISSPSGHSNSFFNISLNKTLFDTIFGVSGMVVNDSPFKTKVHILKQESQILFTLIYPSYSQILKRIRSLSHSPSLSRSSSLGDYASLNNNHVLNDFNAASNEMMMAGGSNLPLMSQSMKRVAICVSWSCNLDDENHLRMFFRFILYFFQFLSQLAEKVAQIHHDSGAFCNDKMTRARHCFIDSLRSFFTTPRISMPIWTTFTILTRYPYFKESSTLAQMKRVFFDKIVLYLINKYHNKEKDFVLAKLLTAVLMYHQGWIHSFNPLVRQKHIKSFTTQPGICRLYDSKHNNLTSQLATAMLGCGGICLGRTIVYSSHTNLSNIILYFLTYFIRFSPLTLRQEDTPDLTQLTDCKKPPNIITTRRKSASCTENANDSCNCTSIMGSQEDLRRVKLSSGGKVDGGSSSSSIHMIGLGATPSSVSNCAATSTSNVGGNTTNTHNTLPRNNSMIATVHPSSSAANSMSSSPVRDQITDQQVKNYYTTEQLLSVDLIAKEFFLKTKSYAASSIGGTESHHHNNNGSSGGKAQTNIYVKELPLLVGGSVKLEKEALQSSFGHFVMGSVTDHVVPGLVLQATSEYPLGGGVLGTTASSGSGSVSTSSAWSNGTGGGGVGVSIPSSPFTDDLRSWLRHSYLMFQPARRADMNDLCCPDIYTEPLCPLHTTAIVLNADKCIVSLVTVANDTRSDSIYRDLESPSPLVMNILDQLQALLTSTNTSSAITTTTTANNSSSASSSASTYSISTSNNNQSNPLTNDYNLIFHAIECQLARIHRLSLSLAHCLRELRHCTDLTFDTSSLDRVRIAKIINCHTDDLPLLYSTALSHSPDIYLQDGTLLY